MRNVKVGCPIGSYKGECMMEIEGACIIGTGPCTSITGEEADSLKACPFCGIAGGMARLNFPENHGDGCFIRFYADICKDWDNGDPPRHTPREMLEAWNRREEAEHDAAY